LGEKRITGAVSYRSYNAEQIELRLGLTIKRRPLTSRIEL